MEVPGARGQLAGMRGTIEDRIAALAAQQHGLVTREQLLEAGLTRSVVQGRLEKRRLQAVQRGIYRVGPIPLPTEREMAAALACGARAAVSHANAGWLWELRPRPAAAAPVTVRVPEHTRIRRPGVRVYRTRCLGPDDVARVAGIPVTSPARTIIDLAAVLGDRDLERVLARAEAERLVAREHIVACLARNRWQPGAAALARLLGAPGAAAFTRSELEDRFRDEIRNFRLPPPRFNQRVAGHEVDCYWPEACLVAELDGQAYHASWRSQERDRDRDADLAAAGITVIRVSWRQLVEETGPTMVRIAQALAVGRDRLARERLARERGL
jgi:very-short-patch-repair endonuclease